MAESRNPEQAGPVLELVDLHKTFRTGLTLKEVQAVRGVNLQVKPGEIFGYLGPNGAGKTTTMKMAMGLIAPTQGHIKIFGRPVTDRSVRQHIGYLPEHPFFYDYLTGAELVGYYGRLFGLSRRECKKRADELLDLVGLAHAKNRRLRGYSKGMLQRTGIAQAMVNDPDFLVLDEPLGGLDPIGRREVRDIVLSLRDQGKTIFFSSHILHDIETICDRVAIIHHGLVERVGKLDALLGGQTPASDVTAYRPGSEADEVKLIATLEATGATCTKGEMLNIRVEQGKLQEVLSACVELGARVTHVAPRRETLEDLFMREAGGSREAV